MAKRLACPSCVDETKPPVEVEGSFIQPKLKFRSKRKFARHILEKHPNMPVWVAAAENILQKLRDRKRYNRQHLTREKLQRTEVPNGR